MKRRHLVAALALALPRPAAAEPHKLLVMQSEGRADAATRVKIDAAILKLARSAEPQTTAGELTFSDAATAVGCKPEVPACADEVLTTLGVDEIVITSVAPKPGGLEIVVQRVAKGGGARDATMLLAVGASVDKLDGIAPLFSGPPPAAAPAGPADPPEPSGPPLPSPMPAAAVDPILSAEPVGPPVIDAPSKTAHRLELAGMGTGAGLMVLGVFLWGAARGAQTDIDNAPTNTVEDLAALRDHESDGDTYATLGNLFVLTGLALGGVATYFYVRDHRSGPSAPVARLTPTLLDHGAGVVLTFGAP